MPKSATLSSAAPTSSRGSGVRKPAHGARSSGMTAKQIDPALRRAIVQGDVVRGTLVFEKAGKVDVSFTAAPIGAPAAGGHKH